jgi:formylglycine-generating enzyme required for sulfatase activity
MGENPSFWNAQNVPLWDGAKALMQPVESVSWHECTDALRRVGLALPTEAQWEYGARARTDSPYWTGSQRESLRGAANIADISYGRMFRDTRFREEWIDDGFGLHARVGSFEANAFGVHDVAGNVWEWCRDLFGGYELDVAEEDGLRLVPEQDGPRPRINRGGSFENAASLARSAFRGRILPDGSSPMLGVRAARSIDPE